MGILARDGWCRSRRRESITTSRTPRRPPPTASPWGHGRDRRRRYADRLTALHATSLGALAALVLIAVAVHMLVISRAPIVRTLGDEARYTREAHRHIDEGVAQLLPGRMLFHHVPPFTFHFFSQFAVRELITHPESEFWIIDSPHETWSPAMARFVRSVSLAHLTLLVWSGVAVYALCARLGAGGLGANVAASLVLLNPRIGFYVQSLWSEILHIALLSSGLLVAVLALQCRRVFPDARKIALLALCGVVLAYALLTRSVVGGFSWVIALVVAVEAFRDARRSGGSPARGLGQGVVYAAVLLGALHGTLLPQRLANQEQHGTLKIAHNSWRNIEGGLPQRAGYLKRYEAAANDPDGREAHSRERVLAYLWRAPKLSLASHQLGQFLGRVRESYIDRGLREKRWGEGVAAPSLARATILMSWLVLDLGLLGLLWRGTSSAGATLVAAFCLYYMAGLLLVIPNVRLFVQLIPPLAVLAGLAIDALATLHARVRFG